MSKGSTSALIHLSHSFLNFYSFTPIVDVCYPPHASARLKSLPVPMGITPIGTLSRLTSYLIISSTIHMTLPSPPQTIALAKVGVKLDYFNFIKPFFLMGGSNRSYMQTMTSLPSILKWIVSIWHQWKSTCKSTIDLPLLPPLPVFTNRQIEKSGTCSRSETGFLSIIYYKMDDHYSHIDYKEQRRLGKQLQSNITLDSVAKYFKNRLNIQIKEMEKLSTNGVINLLYLLSTPDSRLLLRVANPHPFWRKVKTPNEVTVLKLVKEKTNLPVPEIIDYQIDQQHCPLKCQYILFEYIENDGTLQDYLMSVKDSPGILQICKSLMREGLTIVSQISKLRLNNEYIAGTDIQHNPIGLRWDGPAIGPFKKVSDLICEGLKISISHIQKYQNEEQVIVALKKVRENASSGAIDELIKSKQFLWRHGDLHRGNISVKNGKINGIYDWQTSRTGLLQQHDRQYDMMGWYTDLDLPKKVLSVLQNYQNQLIQQLKIPTEPNWEPYKKYFEIMHYSFWSWFYSVTWWAQWPDQKLPQFIQAQKQTNLAELKAALRKYGFL